MMRISVFGLGYVGSVTCACFAEEGHEVVGVDVDPVKLDIIRSGGSPIIEEGLSELMSSGVGSKRIRVTNDAQQAISETDMSVICVGTPSRRNGSLDTSILHEVTGQIGRSIANKSDRHLIVFRSTVQPGTVNQTLVPLLEEKSQKRAEDDFDVCFNPEFLREGSSIADFYNPPFSVVGVRSPEVGSSLKALYRNVKAPFFSTTIETAEMIKCTCNCFHALKIAFANEIGNLCGSMGIDSHEVMKIFCADQKLNVSPAYLKPGFAFGGSCLPKDLRALEYQATSLDQDIPLIRAILPSNSLHIEKAIQMVLDTRKKKVGMLGLSFKPGTDDMRESPLVALAERLLGKGIHLRIFDDKVSLAKLIGSNRRFIEEEIPHISELLVSSLQDLFSEVEVVIVGSKTPQFEEAVRTYTREHHLVIDLVRITGDPPSNGRYRGICW